jgi:hypothetical protein
MFTWNEWVVAFAGILIRVAYCGMSVVLCASCALLLGGSGRSLQEVQNERSELQLEL